MAIKNFRATVSMIAAGNFCQVVWFFQTDDTSSRTPYVLAKDLRDALRVPAAGDSVLEALSDCLAEDAFVSSVRVQQQQSPGAPSAITLFPSDALPGTFSGELDAAQVAGCIIWLTAGDAGLNGRSFIPAVSEEAYQNGRPDGDYTTAIDALATALIATIEGDLQDWQFVLKHGAGPSYTEIVHGYLSPTPGTQRRRLVPY